MAGIMCEDDSRMKVFKMFNGRCAYCGCKLNYKLFEVDHFKPRSKGGKGYHNSVPACFDCNHFKSNLSIEEFRKKLTVMISKCLNSHYGRMIMNYCGCEPVEPVVFYFEQVVNAEMDKVIANSK